MYKECCSQTTLLITCSCTLSTHTYIHTYIHICAVVHNSVVVVVVLGWVTAVSLVLCASAVGYAQWQASRRTMATLQPSSSSSSSSSSPSLRAGRATRYIYIFIIHRLGVYILKNRRRPLLDCLTICMIASRRPQDRLERTPVRYASLQLAPGAS